VTGQRAKAETELADVMRALLGSSDIDSIQSVRLVPRAVPTPTGLTNQGRAHSRNPAHLEHNGLFFRSPPEVHLFEALVATGLPVMPLPVVTSNRQTHRRIEPDFVVVKCGMTFVVEVDGDRYHRETPAKAQERLRHLEDEGVRIIRVTASECLTPIGAANCAADILRRIGSMLAATR
jgi:hypothetical protein